MRADISSFSVTDICAAVYTPYKDDGTVDVGAIDSQAAFLAKQRVPYVFVDGTTGDSMCLSTDERKVICEAWVAAGKKHGLTITVHISAASITDSLTLARHAEQSGAKMIAAMSPQFFKTNNPKVIAQWLKKIGEAAPNTPLYYYHFPLMTHIKIDPFVLFKAIEEVGIPTFRGAKFTDYNLGQFANCLLMGGKKYDLLYGRDEAMVAALAVGAKSSIGNGFCYAAGVYHRLRAAFFKGDLAGAMKEQERILAMINVLTDPRFGGDQLVTSRHLLELRGVQMGPVRTPHESMTPAQVKELDAELNKIGFWEWCD